jgi:hypothetical protein
MKWIQHVQTRDGKLHHDYIVAKRHAEKVYGEALSSVARKIVALDWKYVATMEFLDANLDAFIELKALKDDIALIKDCGHEVGDKSCFCAED